MSGDGKWLAVADWFGPTLVYEKQGSRYFLNQSIPMGDDISGVFTLDMTSDHEWLAMGKGSGVIKIYTHNGLEYMLK